ncbi:MAG: HipA domain-containing protein [Terracidiphilus sp.]|jgi:serine/threonine-protein kinase HipA
MTFDTTQECYVYITLPGAVSAVTAGKFVIEMDPRGDPLGRFVYGRSYLENSDAVDIDPVELKLAAITYETIRMKGVFGALRDASPDFWGRRIIEKRAGIPKLREIDYLLESPDDRAGALGFGLNRVPPAPRRKFNQTIELERLQELAESLVRDEIPNDSNTEQAQDLLLLGTSMGGARPKAVIESKDELWIAKFSRYDDRWNYPRVEHAMLELARQCGIDAAESRLVNVAGKDVLLIRRFDRKRTPTGYNRARMISGLTALRADEAQTARDRWSYILLAEELRRIVSEPKADARDLFRRMCFNALISNTDDHPRNHAFIAFDRNWRLSPTYDLIPLPTVSQDRRDLAMECGRHGRFANATNILSEYPRFLLHREEAEKIVYGMQEQVAKTWNSTALQCGVSAKDVETIRGAFVYPGFSRDIGN